MFPRLMQLQLALSILLLAVRGSGAEFWDSDFVNTLYSFVRYKGYFVSLFQHATKPDHFFYSPLVVLDKESGRVFNNYLRGVHEIDFNVVMSTEEMRAEVVQHLVSSKQVKSPQVQMIPMETVRFTYASALRRGSMKLDLETTAVPNNHLPNSLPIKFYSFSETDARSFLTAVQQHPAILDQLVLEYTITQRRTAEKQVEIKAEYIASTSLFAQLSTMSSPGTVRYLTARDSNAIASQSFSSIRAKVVRSVEYIEGPDELRLTQMVEQLLTRDAARWSELSEAARQSVFWDPAFARPDEVTSLLNRVYEREAGSERLLTVREDQREAIEKQAGQTTACYVFQCAGSSSETTRKLDTRQRVTEDQVNQFFRERQIEVEYTGRLFVVKNMQLYRVNTADFQGGQTIATSSVQVTKKQEIHSLKLKTDSELPDNSEAVSRAACPNSPYSYKGCYEDMESARDLDGFSQESGDMQVRQCYELCNSRGSAFFGLQGGDTCYCGASYGRYRMRPDTECSTRCGGDSSQRCGGVLRNSVFGVDKAAPTIAAASAFLPAAAHSSPAATAPENVYNSTRFEYRGCFADSEAGRQPWLMQQNDLMSVEACYQFCAREQQAAWFGLRAGTECHCRRQAPRLKRLGDAECRTACAGDARRACGGATALSLYGVASLRQGVESAQQPAAAGGGPFASADWGAELAASASALNDRGIGGALSGGVGGGVGGSASGAVSGGVGGAVVSAGSAVAGGLFKELGCPGARDAFIELSFFQTPGLVAADCAAFCRADDATVKYFRIGGGAGGSSGGGGVLGGFAGAFNGGFSTGSGDGGFGCACLHAMMPEARIAFGSGRASNCGGYKYYSIDGR